MQQSGEPTADSSLLPTYWLSRVTRQHVKAAISGDGGDELFGGYDRYRAMRVLRSHQSWLRAVPSMIFEDRDPKSLRSKLRRLVQAAGASDPAEQYRRMVHLFSDEHLQRLGIDSAGGPWPNGEVAALPDWPDEPNPVHAAMRWDLTHYLPFVLLRKVDRASMAVALEVRCPMLDTQVCDLAGHLPERVLMPGGQAKGLLRRLAAQLLPARIAQRSKQGFAVPIGAWLAGPQRDALHDHLLGGPLDSFGFDRNELQTMFRDHVEHRHDHTHRLFGLLQLALFAQWQESLPTPSAR